MGVYIGVDFHARTQSVCWCDTATGEIQERVLDHQRDDVRAFYAQFAAPAVVHTLEPATRFRRSRQVAAYCGLDPQEHSSGDTQRYGHISKQGNRLLRTLLVEAAYCTVRPKQDEELRRFYFRLLARKNSAVAIVAVGRKLALRLYRMLRDEIDYDEFRRRGREARRARWEQSPATKPD